MSDADPPALEEDGIPPGKRLVRAGGGAGPSLGERLSAQFYRLTWRTPLHGFRLRGRHPLKLLAAPVDPIHGDAGIGQDFLDGAIWCEGDSAPLEDNGPRLDGASPRLAAHFHRFDWLRDIAAVGDRSASQPRAEALVRGWLAAHGETVSEPAWNAGNAGRRILNWMTHAPLILATNDLVYRSSVLTALARTARHLDRAADREAPGIDCIAAWAGIVGAGLLIAGGEPRRIFGEAGLAKALSIALTDDGGIISRSPCEQLELVGLLAMLMTIYDARKLGAPSFLVEALGRSVPPLQGTVLGDGGLSSWQGGVPIAKSRIEAIIAASGERARPLRQARAWGYQRMSGGATIVICDAAPPPHSRAAQTGCASTLALELSDGPHRVIVNCGGAAAAGLHRVSGLGDGLRTSAAHSTLILADTNSTAVRPNGSLGKGVDGVELDRQESDAGSKVEASHDGYARRFGFIHKRSLALSVDGRELRGEDTLTPARDRRKPTEARFAVRFHLAPDVDTAPTADGMGALLRIDGGPLWQFRCRGGSLTIDGSLWVDGNGKWHNSQQLVIGGEAAPGGATIGWVFRRAG
jgi:uncharacterized heparinase superfamily protein